MGVTYGAEDAVTGLIWGEIELPRILHIAGWYPTASNPIEGNFIRSHIRLFLQQTDGDTLVVQVRQEADVLLRLRRLDLDDGARGNVLVTRFGPGKITEVLATLLLMFALLRARSRRYVVLHYHNSHALLAHVYLTHVIGLARSLPANAGGRLASTPGLHLQQTLRALP